ncbi:MAG: YigZ family protein [Flavobacteriaceae bacterium]
MNKPFSYRTLSTPSGPYLFKEQKSKFWGYAFTINAASDLKELLIELRKKHPKARHFCYAWRIGTQPDQYQIKAFDDGEPNFSAGTPILGQINAFNLTQTTVIVVREFGGVKLGVGGLIQAYKEAAQGVLTMAEIQETRLTQPFKARISHGHFQSFMSWTQKNQIDLEQQVPVTLGYELIVHVPLFLVDESAKIWGDKKDCFWEPIL